jgi:hypothetical protein
VTRSQNLEVLGLEDRSQDRPKRFTATSPVKETVETRREINILRIRQDDNLSWQHAFFPSKPDFRRTQPRKRDVDIFFLFSVVIHVLEKVLDHDLRDRLTYMHL